MAYCDRCERSFPHNYALEQHMDNSGFHWICYPCDLDFASYHALKGHYIRSPNHHYCRDCDRVFQNQNNLQQHLNSRTHQQSNFKCPGDDCNRAFISAAALVLHFESGACPSGMTREQFNRLVVRADRNNVITNSSRLIGGPMGYEAPTNTSTWATERSWNGVAFECFLCHSTYSTLYGLNQHLKSPAHDQRIYRCPNSDCLAEFVALSALCQHVESGSCGVRMFRQVQNAMGSLTGRFNEITL